jgi:Fic family protein
VCERAGSLKKNFSGEAVYQSFLPKQLPPDPPLSLDSEAIGLLVRANKALQQLETLTSVIPNLNHFVSMYVRKEALMTSQIEGIQATLEDLLDPKLEENIDRNVGEVVNYIKATNHATELMNTLPLSNRLIREAHRVLTEGLRGQEKTPGEFRRSQNWIGGVGSTLATARFIPPNPKDMQIAISDLERYIHAESEYDPLIRAALIHYQFETIHPFLDGNGRIGRLLVVLFLIDKGLLSAPVLYISFFLKRYRIEYYDRLTEVRQTENYEQWVKFFLRAFFEAAENAVDTIIKLNALHVHNLSLIRSIGRGASNALRLFDLLWEHPILTIGIAETALDVSFNTASGAVKRLVELGILQQVDTGKRNRHYAYTEYLDILRRGTEPL